MSLPRWLFVVVAIWVIAFGVFRLYLAATRNRPVPEGKPDFRRRGLYARPARTHFLYGVLYLVLGAYLVATAFGRGPTLEGGCRSGEAPPAALDAR